MSDLRETTWYLDRRFVYRNKHGAVGYVEDPHSNPGLITVVKVWGEDAEPVAARIHAMLAAPTAKGGTEDEALRYAESLARALHEKHWTVDAPEWQPLAGDLIGLLTQIDNMTAGLKRSPTAAAVGGGLGDLGALSAGATQGEWHYRCAIPGRAWIADAPEGQSHSKIILGKQALYGGDADYAFVAALVSAYRSGRLIEASAPTPDLGAQGEPVAWAYEYRDYCTGDWMAEVSAIEPEPNSCRRNIRPLYAAPAAPRTGSGVSVEEIAGLEERIKLKASEPSFQQFRDALGANLTEAGYLLGFKLRPTGTTSMWVRLSSGREIIVDEGEWLSASALIVQAPRDGGETQGGQTQAARDVLAEWQRQVEDEKWTPEHDDEHSDGQMSAAAAAYSFSAAIAGRYFAADPIGFWPWEPTWFKPTTPRRDLVKAGALILAEIERLDRATPPSGVEAIR